MFRLSQSQSCTPFIFHDLSPHFNRRIMREVTNEAGTSYSSFWGTWIRVAHPLFVSLVNSGSLLCCFLLLLLLLLFFFCVFLWPLCFLHFNLRLLITPFHNTHCIQWSHFNKVKLIPSYYYHRQVAKLTYKINLPVKLVFDNILHETFPALLKGTFQSIRCCKY